MSLRHLAAVRLAAPTAALALAVALALLAPTPTAGEAPPIPGPSFEEVIRLREPGRLALSPDGSTVAFEVRTADFEANRLDREIWLARPGEEPFQLTRTAGGDSRSPRWSPDGRWLAFVADRGDGRQIHLIRAAGGEAQALTSVKEGVDDFRWSPDGRTIAFSREEPAAAAEKRKERYGDFAVEDAEYRQSHLWLVEVKPDPWPSPPEAPCGGQKEDGEKDGEEGTAEQEGAESGKASAAAPCARLPEPRRLTAGAFTVESFRWSPDGGRIAFAFLRDDGLGVFLYDIASGALEPVSLSAGPGRLHQPQGWSADGSRLALVSVLIGP
jgi:dipeptidyl aminopeptidase/acylaminoacyl peptidase